MKRILPLIILATAAAAAPAHAVAVDPLIEGAKQCTRHLPRYEREYAIPSQLLSAIASTESGRYHDGLKIKLPYPWTINAEGKGYFYDSKAQAIAAAKQFRARGVKSMDVGCMQVNLMHHPNAFASLEEAFEPQNNVAYAAGFLRALYQEEGSWKQAAASYHSKTPSRGKEYVGLVYNSWYQIVDKLRLAKLQVPSATISAMDDMRLPLSKTKHDGGPKIIQVAQNKIKPLSEQKGKKVAAHRSPKMNTIKVGAKTRSLKRENGIIVVRPQIKAVDTAVITRAAQPSMTIAEAKPSAGSVMPGAVATQSVSAVKKSGPSFVFSD